MPHWAAMSPLQTPICGIHSDVCYHPCGFYIVHAEQVTDLPPMFLHIAWELILAWGREDDSLQEGC